MGRYRRLKLLARGSGSQAGRGAARRGLQREGGREGEGRRENKDTTNQATAQSWRREGAVQSPHRSRVELSRPTRLVLRLRGRRRHEHGEKLVGSELGLPTAGHLHRRRGRRRGGSRRPRDNGGWCRRRKGGRDRGRERRWCRVCEVKKVDYRRRGWGRFGKGGGGGGRGGGREGGRGGGRTGTRLAFPGGGRGRGRWTVVGGRGAEERERRVRGRRRVRLGRSIAGTAPAHSTCLPLPAAWHTHREGAGSRPGTDPSLGRKRLYSYLS